MKGGEKLLDESRTPLDPDAFVVALIGASAVGKSTLAEALQSINLVEITPTISDRPMRAIEKKNPPSDRIFKSEEGFTKLERQGKFLAVEPMYGANYAVPYIAQPLFACIPLLVLKPCLVKRVKAYYPQLQVYHIEARAALLPDRMRDRGQSEASIADRMWEHGVEVIESRQLADRTIENNAEISTALKQLAEYICADYVQSRPDNSLAALSPAVPDSATIEGLYDTIDSMESFA